MDICIYIYIHICINIYIYRYRARHSTPLLTHSIPLLIGFEFRGISRYKFKLRFLFHLNLQLTKNLPTIQDVDLHFFQNFESHFLGNALYYTKKEVSHR